MINYQYQAVLATGLSTTLGVGSAGVKTLLEGQLIQNDPKSWSSTITILNRFWCYTSTESCPEATPDPFLPFLARTMQACTEGGDCDVYDVMLQNDHVINRVCDVMMKLSLARATQACTEGNDSFYRFMKPQNWSQITMTEILNRVCDVMMQISKYGDEKGLMVMIIIIMMILIFHDMTLISMHRSLWVQPLRLPPDWKPWGLHLFIKASFRLSKLHFVFLLVSFFISLVLILISVGPILISVGPILYFYRCAWLTSLMIRNSAMCP